MSLGGVRCEQVVCREEVGAVTGRPLRVGTQDSWGSNAQGSSFSSAGPRSSYPHYGGGGGGRGLSGMSWEVGLPWLASGQH